MPGCALRRWMAPSVREEEGIYASCVSSGMARGRRGRGGGEAKITIMNEKRRGNGGGVSQQQSNAEARHTEGAEAAHSGEDSLGLLLVPQHQGRRCSFQKGLRVCVYTVHVAPRHAGPSPFRSTNELKGPAGHFKLLVSAFQWMDEYGQLHRHRCCNQSTALMPASWWREKYSYRLHLGPCCEQPWGFVVPMG